MILEQIYSFINFFISIKVSSRKFYDILRRKIQKPWPWYRYILIINGKSYVFRERQVNGSGCCVGEIVGCRLVEKLWPSGGHIHTPNYGEMEPAVHYVWFWHHFCRQWFDGGGGQFEHALVKLRVLDWTKVYIASSQSIQTNRAKFHPSI